MSKASSLLVQHMYIYIMYIGKSVVNEEIKSVFPTTSTTVVDTPNHQDVLAHADRLLVQLRSKPGSLPDKQVRRCLKHIGKEPRVSEESYCA